MEFDFFFIIHFSQLTSALHFSQSWICRSICWSKEIKFLS
jgi:hypothetical protein